MVARLEPTIKISARIFLTDDDYLRQIAAYRNEDHSSLIRNILHAYCEGVRAKTRGRAA